MRRFIVYEKTREKREKREDRKKGKTTYRQKEASNSAQYSA
jgi:hypothetical protein